MEKILELFLEKYIPKHDTNEPSFIDLYKEGLSINTTEDFEALSFIWKKYGISSFNNGMFWLINPIEYKEILLKYNYVTEKCIPFLRTALGNFLIWDYEEIEERFCVQYLDIHKNSYEFRDDSISFLFGTRLCSNNYWNYDLNGALENLAINKFTDLQEDECVGFVPALVLGGEEKQENMQKMKLKEHLFLLSELHKKID